jgi:hypothetical protein
VALLDGLKHKPGPASQMRILRMRGKEAPDWNALISSLAYAECQDWLARCLRPPELQLT